MKTDLLNFDVLTLDAGNVAQNAAFLTPAIRGVCKPSSFPSVRFQPAPALTKDDFFAAAPVKEAVWIGRANDIRTLYEAIDRISAGTRLVAIESIGVFAAAPAFEQAQRLLDAVFLSFRLDDVPAAPHRGRMNGRVIVVTGGAQGLGKGIANALLAEGACVVIADLNVPLAQKTAAEFCLTYGENTAIALGVDVSNDDSVAQLCRDTVLHYGGIDVMFSNAGIVISGDLEQMTSEQMARVSNVNYIGYFRCTKYASRYMKIQSAFDPAFTSDVINTSSVAGLIGYRKNFAYCGSKFAVLGLTECFAKELLPHGIKVNSVCPGNYYDGPLWNDPEKGLFLQYLKAGKIPNGKTVQDSKDYYMNREPFHRGCQPEDIAAAVLYCIEQQFETGIALPVTGGLAMGAI